MKFEPGDMVKLKRLVSDDPGYDKQFRKFIGKTGKILSVTEDSKFPYQVKFKNRNSSIIDIFREEELQIKKEIQMKIEE